MSKCSIDGCNRPVWSKGVCRMHAPKTSLSKDRKFKMYPNSIAIEQIKGKRDEFFRKIWSKRPHVCQHCGSRLYGECRSYMFDHILEKSKYPDLAHEEENIWLVCLKCHDEKTRGILTDKYKEKITFVKTKYNLS